MKNKASVHAVVEQTVKHYIDMACKQHGRIFPMPKITYFQTGRKGGHASLRNWEVAFNAGLLEDNLQRYLVRTIPHEVTHLICYALNGIEYSSGGKCIWHGASFKTQMQAFGCETTRCHNMDTTKVRTKKRNTKKHPVECTGCEWTGTVGTVRKNKMLQGAVYMHRGGKNHTIELI